MGVFSFKQFEVDDRGCGMKICSDSVLLGAWFCRACPGAGDIIDIGAGSGILSLIAAQFCPAATINAVEIDSAAADACRQNFANSPWAGRLDVHHCDFKSYSPGQPADLIICNPPYFNNGEHSVDKARATARHQNGLTYSALLLYAKANLASQGHLGLVAPAEFEDEIIFRAELCGMKLHRLCRVRTSLRKPCTRILLDFSTTEPATESFSELVIKSPEYLALVGDLYLKIS